MRYKILMTLVYLLVGSDNYNSTSYYEISSK